MESRKYRFLMWFVNKGPYSFWFRASSSLKCVGLDLGVNRDHHE